MHLDERGAGSERNRASFLDILFPIYISISTPIYYYHNKRKAFNESLNLN
jgi:hypothetical protein